MRAMYDVTATRRILVTGATGFVGHHAVLELLHRKWHQVLCLSRDPNARARLLGKLSALPGWDPVMADRVVVLSGDITHPDIFTADDAVLADNVDTVLHAAAEVRWTEVYALCRQAHVEGTRNLLAFAARGRRKSFIYIPSMAVLHWLDPSGAWNDETPGGAIHQKALDWGYARGKRVAETLVQHARNSGLAARIVRPGLVWGHSATGHAKGEGVLAAMLRACIHMGLAPGLNWHIDACPVDIVARAMATQAYMRVDGAQGVEHEAHRESLAETAALPLNRSTWQRGVQLALADLLVDRLASWAMLHYVRPGPLLPQALRNWWRLAQVSALLPSK